MPSRPNFFRTISKISKRAQFSWFEGIYGLSREKITPRQENILHEACHAVTLGVLDRLNMAVQIEKKLKTLDNKGQADDELHALAVEVVILRRYGALLDRKKFLNSVLGGQTYPLRLGGWNLEQAIEHIGRMERRASTKHLADEAEARIRGWAKRWPKIKQSI